jgi:hypothetical protein
MNNIKLQKTRGALDATQAKNRFYLNVDFLVGK